LLAEQGRYADAIAEYVRLTDCVSFVQLQQRFAPYLPTRGDQGLYFGDHVVFWRGMSGELVTVLLTLKAERRIYLHPCSPLVYLVDGRLPSLPTVKRPPRGGYQSLHWAPGCFRVVPIPEVRPGRQRRSRVRTAERVAS
jgi:hypothetical protein